MNIPCIRIAFIVLVAFANLCSCMWYNSYLYTNIDDIEKHLTDVQGKILKGNPTMDNIGNFMKVTEVLMLLSNGAIEEAWNTWQTTTMPNKLKLLYKNSLKATSKEWEFFYSLQSVISVACLKSTTEGKRRAAAAAWTTLAKSIAAKNAFSPEIANRMLWSDMLELVPAIIYVHNINLVKLLCSTHMEIMLHQWELNYRTILFHKELPSIDEHNSDSSTTNSNPDNKFVSNSKLKDLALLQAIRLKFLRYYFEDGNTITRPFSHARLIHLQQKYGIEIDQHIPPLSYGSKVCFQLQYEAEKPWHTYEENYRELSRSNIAKDMLNVQDQRINAILRPADHQARNSVLVNLEEIHKDILTREISGALFWVKGPEKIHKLSLVKLNVVLGDLEKAWRMYEGLGLWKYHKIITKERVMQTSLSQDTVAHLSWFYEREAEYAAAALSLKAHRHIQLSIYKDLILWRKDVNDFLIMEDLGLLHTVKRNLVLSNNQVYAYMMSKVPKMRMTRSESAQNALRSICHSYVSNYILPDWNYYFDGIVESMKQMAADIIPESEAVNHGANFPNAGRRLFRFTGSMSKQKANMLNDFALLEKLRMEYYLHFSAEESSMEDFSLALLSTLSNRHSISFNFVKIPVRPQGSMICLQIQSEAEGLINAEINEDRIFKHLNLLSDNSRLAEGAIKLEELKDIRNNAIPIVYKNDE